MFRLAISPGKIPFSLILSKACDLAIICQSAGLLLKLAKVILLPYVSQGEGQWHKKPV
jgi:hypothetical protein